MLAISAVNTQCLRRCGHRVRILRGARCEPEPYAGTPHAALVGTMNPRALMTEHHREVETACCSLLGCTYADDPKVLLETYRRFEQEILEHLRAEEELLLPGYAEFAPHDARKLREEHDELRRALFRIGVDVELHAVRVHHVDHLIAELRAHAAHEDTGLYTWAAAHLSAVKAEQLLDRIRHSLTALRRMGVRQEPAPAHYP